MWWRAHWLQQRQSLVGLAVFDALVIVGTYNALFWQRFDRWAGVTGSVATLVLLWLTLSYLLGRYSRSETDKQLWSIGWIAVVVTALTMGAAWLGLSRDPRALPDFVLPLLGGTAGLSALAERSVDHQARRSNQWLLLVSQQEGATIERELQQQEAAARLSLEICHSPQQALSVLTNRASRQGIVLGEEFDLGDELVQALLLQRSQGQTVIELIEWCEWQLQRVPPELLSSRWLLLAEGFRLRPGKAGWRLKRLGDLLVAGVLLMLSSPLLLLAAVIIKLEDGGPVLYSQIRTGLYGQPFRIWKLRSMRKESEAQGVQWASRRDPRITRVGGCLRRLRLDELPQLVNVIMGDMSLIGPRPERPEFENNLEQLIPHYRIRHWIRPGLSGWAQVCFTYGASVDDSRTKLSFDLYYLRNFSLGLDGLILLKTIRLVARAEGALPQTPWQPR
jgi:exopolysaccharide biosynthesis polyprenyl glycosylphosphotransferase